MTRQEVELTIINKLFEIRALAKEYDENIMNIMMSVSEYPDDDDEDEVLRGLKMVRFYTNKDLCARWSSSDGEIYEPDTMKVLAEGVEPSVKLKKGDLIKCTDADDAANVADALAKNGIEWEFVYEHDGERGIWIEIREDER